MTVGASAVLRCPPHPLIKQQIFFEHLSQGWGQDHTAGHGSVQQEAGAESQAGEERGDYTKGWGEEQRVSEWSLPWGHGFEKETGLRGPKQSETSCPQCCRFFCGPGTSNINII